MTATTIKYMYFKSNKKIYKQEEYISMVVFNKYTYPVTIDLFIREKTKSNTFTPWKIVRTEDATIYDYDYTSPVNYHDEMNTYEDLLKNYNLSKEITEEDIEKMTFADAL